MSKPKIRFKGYTDEWEQRKLGDLVERVTRKKSRFSVRITLNDICSIWFDRSE